MNTGEVRVVASDAIGMAAERNRKHQLWTTCQS